MFLSSPPLFDRDCFVIASHNRGKIQEINALLQAFVPQVVPVACFSSVEPDENGQTFEENALIKAKHAALVSGCCALGDDSGLEIDVLSKQPGIHSARFAKEYGGFESAMENLLEQLKNYKKPEQRKARFVCALALVIPNYDADSTARDFRQQTFVGSVEGTIASDIDPSPYGFGYDPIFIPNGYQQTFASLEPPIKNTISHRQKAFEQLLSALISAQKPTPFQG